LQKSFSCSALLYAAPDSRLGQILTFGRRLVSDALHLLIGWQIEIVLSGGSAEKPHWDLSGIERK
jgi:hypothetical protein